jgi:arylsulfatase A
MDRRDFLKSAGITAGAACWPGLMQAASGEAPPPNVIIIFADDMGYGDLGCYGHPVIKTPHLDKMALEGVRLTSFYAAAPVCSPSRAALLTGRYPVRCGMPGNTGPGSNSHLPESEVTIANILKEKGYRTMAVGKWHLGHQRPDLLPTGRGFDHWYGLPYSNDMRKPFVQTDVPLKLYRDTEPIEYPIDQTTLTERFTEESIKFIEAADERPFFLYLAHSMPHLPVSTSEKFVGTSDGGLYGDVIETMDWGVGRIRQTLEAKGIAGNTLLIFTSDNGPWLDLPDRMLNENVERWHGGSPGPLRGAKGTTYEGGLRVPMIACWPGHIPAGTRNAHVASTMDLLPTIAAVTGANLPEDRTVDGENILPLLSGDATSPHEYFYYFRGDKLQAVRQGVWKLRKEHATAETELFHMENDPRELYNVAEAHPEIVEKLMERMRTFQHEVRQI